MREAQALAERRRRIRTRWALGVGLAVIVALMATIVAVAANSYQATKKSNLDGPLVNPAGVTAAGTIPVGKSTAPVTLEIFLDYMCPSCAQFEKANSAEIERLIKAGTVKAELHPMNFLDPTSRGTRYSTRAANAVATVADRASDKVWAFNAALYAQQPKEGTSGLSDAKIAEIAVQAGVPQGVADTFTKRTFEPWVAASNKSADKAGVSSTPTVKINGQVFTGNLHVPGPLTQAVQAAAARAGGK
jgi:protein-disulfide isomerase